MTDLYKIIDKDSTRILTGFELTVFMTVPLDFAIICAKKYYGNNFTKINNK